MKIHGSGRREIESCACDKATVFEGAVIGQVFTGDVRVECPFASTGTIPSGRSRHSGSHFRTWITALWAATSVQVLSEALSADHVGGIMAMQVVVVLGTGIVRTFAYLAHVARQKTNASRHSQVGERG